MARNGISNGNELFDAWHTWYSAYDADAAGIGRNSLDQELVRARVTWSPARGTWSDIAPN